MKHGALSVEDLSAYIDGELGWWHRRRVRRHLRACEPCRRYVEHIGGVSAALRSRRPDPPLSRDVHEGLHRAYAEWAAGRSG